VSVWKRLVAMAESIKYVQPTIPKFDRQYYTMIIGKVDGELSSIKGILAFARTWNYKCQRQSQHNRSGTQVNRGIKVEGYEDKELSLSSN